MVFIDGSHVVRPYGDVTHLLLFVLPILPVGTIVHIHDIFLPYDYPASCQPNGIRNLHLVYTEQWAVAMFLYNNPAWRVLLPTAMLLADQPEAFEPWRAASGRKFALPRLSGGSLWLQRVS